MTRTPLLIIKLFFVGGIIFGRGNYMALPFLGFLLVLLRKKKLLLPFVLAFFLGFAIWGQAVTDYEKSFLQEIAGKKVTFKGLVMEQETGRLLLDRVSVKTPSGWRKIQGKYWAWSEQKTGIKVGDIGKTKGVFYPLTGPSNPGEPDWRIQNLAVGIWGNVRLESSSFQKIGFARVPLIKTRNYFRGRMQEALGDEKGSFLGAVLLGQRRNLGTERREIFYSAGLGHILAVSGLHIGFVALLLWFFVDRIPLCSGKKTFLFCIFILFFVVLVGFRPSVVRAGIMSMGLRVSKEIGRGENIFNYLCLSGIFLLLINPFQLWTPGFQLSFLITFFIILGKKCVLQTRGKLRQGLFFSALATLAASPLTALHFHTVNPLNFVANIWALPLTGAIVMSGFCGLVPFLGDFFWRLITLPGIIILESLLEIWVGFPGTSITVSSPPFLGILFYYTVLTFLLFWFEPTSFPLWRKYKNILAKKIFPLFLLIFLVILIVENSDYDKARITFLDVGQGDAVHIFIPGVGNIMVDAGGERGPQGDMVGERVILPYLREKGVKNLKAIFISHFHQDHYRGFLPVLRETPPEIVFGPPLQDVWQEQEFFQKLEETNIRYFALKRGAFFELSPEVIIQVLHPGQDLIRESALNNNSLVLNIQVKDWSFLLTGDIEKEAEIELISREIIPPCEILKVAHHGSSTSSHTEFLEHAHPAFAIIQVGQNPFGHPDNRVIERLENIGAEVLITQKHGAVSFSIDKQGGLRLKNWKGKSKALFPFDDFFLKIRKLFPPQRIENYFGLLFLIWR